MPRVASTKASAPVAPAPAPTPAQPMPSQQPQHGGHLILFASIIAIIVIVVLVLFVLTKTTSFSFGNMFEPSTPNAIFKTDLSKLNTTPEMSINYSVAVPLLASTGLGSNITLNYYKLGTDQKIVAALGAEGAVAIYDIDNISLVCTELAFGLSSGSSGVTCQVDKNISVSTVSTKVGSFVGNALLKNLAYGGEKSIGGSSCDSFTTSINSSQLTQLAASLENSSDQYLLGSLGSQYANLALNFGLCINKQYGYPQTLNVSYTSFSNLTQKNATTMLLAMKATAFSPTSSLSYFKIPVTFAPQSFNCTPNSITARFVAFSATSNTTVVVKNFSTYSYSSGGESHPLVLSGIASPSSFVVGQEYSITIPATLQSDSYYSGSLCVAGSCQSESCDDYVYTTYNYTYPGYTTTVYYGYSQSVLPYPITDTVESPSSVSSSIPSYVTDVVPIIITNYENVSTGSGFQQPVAVNSDRFSSYEASSLDNIVFMYSNGTIINSWLESNNSQYSTDSLYWLKLANIPAGASQTIYMAFATASTNMFNTATTGEAPQLSPTYGQYDNGANVFSFYDNFAGTSLSNKWTTSNQGSYDSYSVNDGLTFTAGKTPNSQYWNYSAVYSISAFLPGSVAESGIVSVPAPISGIRSATPGFSTVNYGIPSADNSKSAMMEFGSGINGAITFAVEQGSVDGYDNQDLYLYSGLYSTVASAEYSGTGVNTYYDGYGNPELLYSRSPAGDVYAQLGIASQSSQVPYSISVSWVRVRQYPPDGVLPSVS